MNVIIVDEMHPSIIEMPKSLGLNVDYFPSISESQFQDIIENYEGLIIRSKFNIDEKLLSRARKLKFIGRAGAGLDLIDIEECKKRGIAIFAANEGNRIAVAEHLIGMLLTLFNKINIANAQIRNGSWKREENRGTELYEKTVGIIGYGNNGQATAERLIAFGCKILAYDKFKYGFGNQFVNECTMQEIFEQTDILTLHIPLTIETNQLVNTKFLSNFKKPIYLSNVSRGEIVNLEALVEGLKSKKILGACLDVLENEKITQLSDNQKVVFDKLCSFDNVILTPHVAGWTHQSYKRINEVLLEKIKDFISLSKA